MTKPLSEFAQGYVMACANLQNLHDEPTAASDTLLQLGASKKEILGGFEWTEYDLKALREIFKESVWGEKP